MAAVTATLMTLLRPGDVLVAVSDGYPGVRFVASERLQPFGVKVRFVPTDTQAVLDAVAGARLVWLETPSNPRLDVLELTAAAEAAHAAGALVAVDNTLATPLGQQPAGAQCRPLGDERDQDAVRALQRGRPGRRARIAYTQRRGGRLSRVRSRRRAPPDDPFRLPRRFHRRVHGTRQAVLDACELVAEATSFGGVHATAERRLRWGTDDVPEGFIRYSAGCEDPEDLVADITAALDRA